MRRITRAALVAALPFAFSAALAGQVTFTEDLRLEVTSPDIELVDTGTGDADWEICIDGGCDVSVGVVGTPEAFHIGWTDGNFEGLPVTIEHNTGDNLLYLDALDRIGINTNVPAVELDIRSASPELRLLDTSAGQVDLRMNGNLFELEGNTNQGILWVDTRAPERVIEVLEPGDLALADSTVVFDYGAPQFSLTLDPSGNLGLGTDDAASPFQIVRPGAPTIRLTDTSGAGQSWDLNNTGNEQFFDIHDVEAGTSPFSIQAGAPDFVVHIAGSGNAGIGTLAPQRKLHVVGDGYFLGSLGLGALPTAKLHVDGDALIDGPLEVTGTLSVTSSRSTKDVVGQIDGETVLDAVLALDLARWHYKSEPGVEHIGPMAEDFRAAFGLGVNERSMSPVDAAGVALAAIQGLHQRLERLAAENASLRSENRRLEDERALVEQHNNGPSGR